MSNIPEIKVISDSTFLGEKQFLLTGHRHIFHFPVKRFINPLKLNPSGANVSVSSIQQV